jgi:hypothetical protein
MRMLGKLIGFILKPLVIAIGTVILLFALIAAIPIIMMLGGLIWAGVGSVILFFISWLSGDADALGYVWKPLLMLVGVALVINLMTGVINLMTGMLGGAGRALFRKPKTVVPAPQIAPYYPYAPSPVARRTARRPMRLRAR